MILMHYFTGTGNTRHALEVLKEHYEKTGETVVMHSIDKEEPQIEGDISLLYIAFPVYAMAVPHLMWHYLKRLPEGNNTPTIVIATYGRVSASEKISGNPGASLDQAMSIMRKKGYQVLASGAFSYPNNMTQISNTPTEDDVEQIIAEADERVINFFHQLKNGVYPMQNKPKTTQIGSRLFGLVYQMGRRCLGKMFVATSQCNQCGLCIENCPAKVIKLEDGKPRWSFSCEGCQRCINICPQQAIQTSLPRLVTVGLITILQIVLLSKKKSFIMKLIELGLVTVVGGYGMDAIIWVCEQNPALCKYFHKNHTEKFRRYSI